MTYEVLFNKYSRITAKFELTLVHVEADNVRVSEVGALLFENRDMGELTTLIAIPPGAWMLCEKVTKEESNAKITV